MVDGDKVRLALSLISGRRDHGDLVRQDYLDLGFPDDFDTTYALGTGRSRPSREDVLEKCEYVIIEAILPF